MKKEQKERGGEGRGGEGDSIIPPPILSFQPWGVGEGEGELKFGFLMKGGVWSLE